MGLSNGSFSDQVDDFPQIPLKASGPPHPRSSAGHTPFPSRLSLMARDLRLGKVGRGPSLLTKDPLLAAGPSVGRRGCEKASNSSVLGLSPGPDEAPISEDLLLSNQTQMVAVFETGHIKSSRGSTWPDRQGAQQAMVSSLQQNCGVVDDDPMEDNGPVLTDIQVPEFVGRNGQEGALERAEALDSDLEQVEGHVAPRV